MTQRDARLDVFLSTAKRDLFHSVEHRGQIWREDPFDVSAVDAAARTQFERLLALVTTPPGLEAGRLLLLLGEAGSGKTHLVRAFRNYAHMNGLGFVGYMQMTTSVSNYGRYILSNLVDSLDQTYYEALGTGSGLHRLSNAVAARCDDQTLVRTLVDQPDLDANAIIDLVERTADRIVGQPRYANLDLDLVRALLFLQRQDTALKKRVIKFLRGEMLSERDQRLLGGLSPRAGEEDAQHLVEQIGRLMWACDSRALILCADQFEDAYRVEDAEISFRRVMSALCALADQVPSCVVVIACLNDYYASLKARLTRSTLDRLERDPAPVQLTTERTPTEIEQIIRQRLAYLYETSNVGPAPQGADPLYPIPRALLSRTDQMRVRDVLDECQRYREACIDAGRILDPDEPPYSVREPPPVVDETRARAERQKIEKEWNDHRTQYRGELPDDDDGVAELFAWAIRTSTEESGNRLQVNVQVKGDSVEVDILSPTGDAEPAALEKILVVVCNKGAQGGGLYSQVENARRRAKERTLVLLRCGEFPRKPGTMIYNSLVDVLKHGGRKAVLEESDKRAIAAFRSFRREHEGREHFDAWRRESSCLSKLLPVIHVLDLDASDRFRGDGDRSSQRPSSPVARGSVSNPPAPKPTSSKKTKSVAPGKPPSQKSQSVSPPESDKPRGAEQVNESLGVEQEITLRSETGGEHRPDAITLTVGTTGELISQELSFDAEVLTAHAAFLGSTGSGKTTLALNIVEQLLARGIPAILVDRKGDLCGYAREKLFSEPHPNPVLEERRRALRERLDIAVFTPGNPEGRQLGLSLVPRGLSKLKETERDEAAGHAAMALGDMLNYRHTRKDKTLRTILVQAFQLFAAHDAADKLDLETLITFIANEDPALVDAVQRIDPRFFKDLVHDLQILKLSSASLLSGAGEQLDAELLLGLGAHAQPGRTRLSILSTKFLGDNARVLFWVSQLLLGLNRWVTRAPSPRLQAVVLFDEADMYLPAQSQPATKAPMENLLRRARSGGLGLLLATQSPGDLDYKCRENLRSWFVGRVTQQVAIDKMKPLLSEARIDVGSRIPGQSAGEFHLLQDGSVKAFKAAFPLLHTEQVPDAEVLSLAARSRQTQRRRT